MILRNLAPFLENNPVEASAPCRLDLGGTLDIRTFYHPLWWLSPSTVNFAIDLRTRVRLLPYRQDYVKISSSGFKTATMTLDTVPFDHPLGLIFAVAYHFRAAGVHIDIESSSPPRSALGGSSVAAVALIAAISKVLSLTEGTPKPDPIRTTILAHGIEESAAGVLCGIQDHLAAVYGGINRWEWRCNPKETPYTRDVLMPPEEAADFGNHLLVAYCGVPHESKDINGTWIRQFLTGATRPQWIEIAECSHRFGDAMKERNLGEAIAAMNREMAIRKEMTPEVLDHMGDRLVAAAMDARCGARITGAGGGGCIWALGQLNDIENLRPIWKDILSSREEATLLDCNIDMLGVTTET